MKFLPVALATLVAFASAAKDCKDEASKVPTCANNCVNTEAAKYCKPGEFDCSCAPATLDKIIKGSTDCVAKECKGQGPVFPALKDFCECKLEGTKPTKTSTTPPKPTSTLPCRAEEAKVPDCAQNCVNGAAEEFCHGNLQCACVEDTLEKIIAKSKDCVEKACKGSGPVFPPLRDFCKCVRDDGHSSTSSSTKSTHSSTKTSASSTATSTKSSTATSSNTSKSSSVTATETSKSSSATASASASSKASSSSIVTSVKPPTNSTASTEPCTTTSKPVTYTSTYTTTQVHTITSCAPEVPSCPAGGKSTETLTLTTTWCPETESQVLPTEQPQPTGTEGVPGPNPPYPTQPGTDVAPGPSNVPSGTPIVSQPPAMTAGAVGQGNSVVLAGIIAAVAALA